MDTGESPLKFILSNPPLKWAWYTLLCFILLFVIFNGKRRKSIIPVLPDRSNTSLEHIQRMSNLYKQKDEHYVIAAKMFENFLWYVQSELKINTTQKTGELIEEIAIKRTMSRKEIKKIFDQWSLIEEQKTLNTESFLVFNSTMNSFYNRIKQ